MPRGLREFHDGEVYHVMARGNNKEEIFRGVADYERFISFVRKIKSKTSIEVYCFALMPNHVHFLLRAAHANDISKFMQLIQSSHSTYFNHKYVRVGHLFQGRFISRLVNENTYFVYLSKYIHRNPVEAGLVKNPEEYDWSSFDCFLKREHRFDFVNTSPLIKAFSDQFDNRAGAYHAFVKSGSDPLPGSDPVVPVVP